MDAGVPVVVIAQSTSSPALTATEWVTSLQWCAPAPLAPLMVQVRVWALPAQVPALGVQIFRVTVIVLPVPGAMAERAYKFKKVAALGKYT